MEPLIRRAARDEVEDLLALWDVLHADQDEHRLYPTALDARERVRAHLDSAIDAGDGTCVFVADVDGRLMGMALVSVRDHGENSLSMARAVEMSTVVVHPDARGAGIGRRLVEEAVAHGTTHGAGFVSAKVFSGNKAALAFWDRMGFRARYEERIRPIR